jgi:hypothetical protein
MNPRKRWVRIFCTQPGIASATWLGYGSFIYDNYTITSEPEVSPSQSHGMCQALSSVLEKLQAFRKFVCARWLPRLAGVEILPWLQAAIGPETRLMHVGWYGYAVGLLKTLNGRSVGGKLIIQRSKNKIVPDSQSARRVACPEARRKAYQHPSKGDDCDR